MNIYIRISYVLLGIAFIVTGYFQLKIAMKEIKDRYNKM